MAVYVIAEIGNTHEGSLGLAKQFARAAAECGVNAVKFQTHIFDEESLASAPNPPYFKDETRKEYFDRTAFTKEQWAELKRFCEGDLGVDFFSSPFSESALELLDEIGCNTFKVASGEVSNLPLLKKMGEKGKRVLLSSGMSSWAEMDAAVEELMNAGCKDLVVLQCTSAYPCPPEQAGLNVLAQLKERYPSAVIGYSDHTLGSAVPLAAIVLGASVVEKHFTLSNKMYGSDARNATEPEEFASLVSDIRALEVALSVDVDKDQIASGLGDMQTVFQKSIVAAKDLKAGEVIKEDCLAFKKPGDGLPASRFRDLLGRTLVASVTKDQRLTENDVN